MAEEALPQGFQIDQGQPQALPQDGAEQSLPQGFELAEDKYSTPGQMATTALEGAGQGIAGPLAPAIERSLGVKAADIKNREEVNPYIKGGAEAASLIGSSLIPGLGEASLAGAVGKAGKLAETALGVAKEAPLMTRVGASAVKAAAETAVMQGSDEASKFVYDDNLSPQSAETALANVGLAAAIGGAGGALWAGAVSPLWNATVGPKIEELLHGAKYHFDGAPSPDNPVTQAAQQLNVPIPLVMQKAMEGDPASIQALNELRESQHPEVLAAFKSLPEDIQKAMSDRIGVPLNEMLNYSDNEAGHELKDTFLKEFDKVHAPVAEQMERKEAEAAPIQVPDEARRDFGGKIVERGMNEVGTDSPYYKTYEHYAQRVMAKDTVGQLDKLKTEIFNKARSASTDINEKNALNQIRNMITDFQDQHIADHEIRTLTKNADGPGWLTRLGNIQENAEVAARNAEMIAQRQAANESYRNFANMSQEVTDHLGIGDFKGAGTLKSRLSGLDPETLLRKFSVKGNADFIPTLQKYFPETYEKLQQVESKKFIGKSVYSDKNAPVLDVSKLNDMIEGLRKGQPEYLNYMIPEKYQSDLKAAQVLLDSIPKIKSSGTAGWISKLTKHIPASVMSAVAMLAGHNPVSGYLLGEMAQRLAVNLPNELKLAWLKWSASPNKVSGSGFKAMVDFLHSAYKGEHVLNNGVKNVFKLGSEVLSTSSIPDAADRARLVKQLDKIEQDPNGFMSKGTDLGHYMPAHQLAATAGMSRAVQYLQTLKPQTQPQGPLDKKIPPSDAQVARYNRALDIAINPNMILSAIKSGKLQISDLQDLKSMYPNYYDRMATKLSQQLISAKNIPYKTKMSLSMFLGQPLDTTMLPSSIQSTQMALQPASAQPNGPQSAQKPQGKKPSQGASTALRKGAKSYQTPSQAAETDRVQGRSD